MRNIEMEMELARRTASDPEGARFVWNLEALWGADLFLRRKSETDRAALIEVPPGAVRHGRIVATSSQRPGHSAILILAKIPFRFCSAVSGLFPIRLASNTDSNLSRLPATIQAAPVCATARKSVFHSCRSPTAAATRGMCSISTHELSMMAKSREARRASTPLKIASPAAQNALPVK
jgi:hypothetical protein